MGRLDGLTGYLTKWEGEGGVILTFDEIEALMGSRLPRSARKAGSPFWATTDRNVYAKAWRDAGYVATFDECGPNEVHFMRAEDAEAAKEHAATITEPEETPEGPDLSTLPPPPPALDTLPPPPVSVADRATAVATELTTAFAERRFIMGKRGTIPYGWEELPDVKVAQELIDRDADPVWVRIVQTFGAVLDRGRGDAARWQRVLAAFDHDVTLFDTEAILSRTMTDLSAALVAAGLAPRLTDVTAWRLAAEVLAYQAPTAALHRVVFDGEGSAPELMAALTDRSVSSAGPVPGLSSERSVVRWIRMLIHPGGASIAGIEELPFVVDEDIRRATHFLGLSTAASGPASDPRPAIAALWREASATATLPGPGALGGTALALEQALAFHGRVGCRWCKTKLTIEPITPACEGCKLRG